MERHFQIRWEQEELTATIHYPAGQHQNKYPTVIICHGFIGNRIGTDRLFVKAARALAEQGYLTLRFDYAGCGESTGDYGRGGMDALISQTRKVLDYVADMDCVDATRLNLLGHSLGGAVALLTAAQDRRVKNLVLWSAVAHPFSDITRITGKQVYEDTIHKGEALYQGYRFSREFFDSLSRYQPYEQVRKVTGNVLIVHGTGDEIVPVDYAFIYQKIFWMRPEGQCDKEIILQADHTFSNGGAADECIGKTVQWLEQMEQKRQEWSHWII
jgi:hypothetical protein